METLVKYPSTQLVRDFIIAIRYDTRDTIN